MNYPIILDTLLLFPPQWSPFQPPLSIPSLCAWIKRAGFVCSSYDVNVEFYDYLFSDECAKKLIDNLSHCDDSAALAHRAIFENVSDFRSVVLEYRSKGRPIDGDELLSAYKSVKHFETYLKAISSCSSGFTISPYSFDFGSSVLNPRSIEKFAENPPPIIDDFVTKFVSKIAETPLPRCFGLSCIGQEQLAWSVLIANRLKRRFDIPVIVGGTILPRIYERGRMPSEWLGRYFDVIVRNEGEKPLEGILSAYRANQADFSGIPGLIFRQNDGSIIETQVGRPLQQNEIPTPDFSQLPLNRYFSHELTLPLLSSRGCYWGKCEFCHHGMVFGDGYSASKTADLLGMLTELTEKYGVRSFAFNDEAIPPRTLREMGATLPPSTYTGWIFTGLIKFEPYYTRAMFDKAYGVGFRSLYVGLESASERVLELMKKNCSKSTMLANLGDARSAGIWMHCFLFFGFPGETEEDAKITYDFILEHKDIIPSIGCGTFSLEHNSPIYFHLKDYGLTLMEDDPSSLNVYYSYGVSSGLDANQAVIWTKRLNNDAHDGTQYQRTNWIPRELLLLFLRDSSITDVLETAQKIYSENDTIDRLHLREYLSCWELSKNSPSKFIVNRLNKRVIQTHGITADVLLKLVTLDPMTASVRMASHDILIPLSSTSGNKPAYLESNKVI